MFVAGGDLVGVDLPRSGAADNGGIDSGRVPSSADETVLRAWVDQLEAYFRGERLGWTTDEVPVGTLAAGPFERAVFGALLAVPPATTISYGALAEMAGYPRAARAVGNVMASNPVPVVVPCHRVIRSDGDLGRYGDDAAWKERLLEHERAHALGSIPTSGGCRS